MSYCINISLYATLLYEVAGSASQVAEEDSHKNVLEERD